MDDPQDMLDDATAAAVLEVAPDRLDVMVADGLLTPAGAEGEGRRFTRAEVEAVRQLGG